MVVLEVEVEVEAEAEVEERYSSKDSSDLEDNLLQPQAPRIVFQKTHL